MHALNWLAAPVAQELLHGVHGVVLGHTARIVALRCCNIAAIFLVELSYALLGCQNVAFVGLSGPAIVETLLPLLLIL